MENILSKLPKKEQVEKLINGKFGLDQLGVGELQQLNINEITANINNIVPSLDSSFKVPELPAALSPENILSNINSTVDNVKSFEPSQLFDNITGSLPLADLEAPGFDLNSIISSINSSLIPVTTGVNNLNTNLQGINFSELMEPLRKLSESGLAAPLKVLNIWLKIIENISTTLSDKDNLTGIAKDSLEEIYNSLLQKLKAKIPLTALENAVDLFEEAADKNKFINKYEEILNKIENVNKESFEEVNELYNAAKEVLPEFNLIKQLNETLKNMKDNKIDNLDKVVKEVVNFTNSKQVFLEEYYNKISETITGIIDEVTNPVTQLTNIAGDINSYLLNVADKAEAASESIVSNILGKAKDATAPLYKVNTVIYEIENNVNGFLDTIKLDDVIEEYKRIYKEVSEKVENVIRKIETLKIKLDVEVIKIEASVNDKVDPAFEQIEKQIKDMLQQIINVLNSDGVKSSLQKAKETVDKCKEIINDAAVKPLFDYFVERTENLERSASQIDTSALGVPEKVALKMGTKIVKEADIDKVIKEELIDIFNNLNEPLKDVVKIVEENLLVVNKRIREFNPGTVASEYILNSDIYKLLINTLETLKPSVLLEPIKNSYQFLKENLLKIDPNVIVDQLQVVIDQIKTVVNVVDPNAVKAIVSDAVNVAMYKLEKMNDEVVASIADKIKKNISLENLLQSTGIQEVANNDFWNSLKNILSGSYLDNINNALTSFEDNLATVNTNFNFNSVEALLQEVKTGFENQLKATVEIITSRVASLKNNLENIDGDLDAFQQRWSNLVSKYTDNKEILEILNRLSLQPVIDLTTSVNSVVTMQSDSLQTACDNVNTVISENLAAIKKLTVKKLQAAVPKIFKKQIGDPTRTLITQVKDKLSPLSDAVTAVQGILDTLTTVPAKIDKSLATIVDTLEDLIKDSILFMMYSFEMFAEEILDFVNCIKKRILKIIDSFNPYWLFNSFSIYDFYGIEKLVDSEETSGFTIIDKGMKNENDYMNNEIGRLSFRFGFPYLEYNFPKTANAEKYKHLFDRYKVKEKTTNEYNQEVIDFDKKINEILNTLDPNTDIITKITLYGFCDPVGSASYHKNTLAVQRNEEVAKHLKGEDKYKNLDKSKLAKDDPLNSYEPLKDLSKYNPKGFKPGGIEIKSESVGEELWKNEIDAMSNQDQRFVGIRIEGKDNFIKKEYSIKDARGIVAVAKAICVPNGNIINLALQTKLTVDELANLKREVVDEVTDELKTLSAGNCKNVIKALNATLRSEDLAGVVPYDTTKNFLDSLKSQFEAELNSSTATLQDLTDEQIAARVETIIKLYRCNVLIRLLEQTRSKYQGAANKFNYLVRLNRLILEAHFLNDVIFSTQTLFALVLEVISHLYPELVVDKLDNIWDTIIKNIKEFPERMIEKPLNEKYKEVTDLLNQYFDVEGVFKILNLKLATMDKEIENGLDRISDSYNDVLNTLDYSLSK